MPGLSIVHYSQIHLEVIILAIQVSLNSNLRFSNFHFTFPQRRSHIWKWNRTAPLYTTNFIHSFLAGWWLFHIIIVSFEPSFCLVIWPPTELKVLADVHFRWECYRVVEPINSPICDRQTDSQTHLPRRSFIRRLPNATRKSVQLKIVHIFDKLTALKTLASPMT